MCKQIESIEIANSLATKGCLILLPGRGGTGKSMLKECLKYTSNLLDDMLIVATTPNMLEWYPSPFGPSNQDKAVAGIEPAVEAISKLITLIQSSHGFGFEKTVVAGFSAGGVVALHCASKLNIAGAVVLSGAALEPKMLKGGSSVPVLMFHNKNDLVFKWESRYIPTKQALKKNEYNVEFIEGKDGGHSYYPVDLIKAAQFTLKSIENKK